MVHANLNQNMVDDARVSQSTADVNASIAPSFPVVGINASAGGLEAFFANILPPGRDMAFLNGTLQLLEPSDPRAAPYQIRRERGGLDHLHRIGQ